MISIIVPYWNSGPWLDRCCQSLQRQTGEFEFIFVDDSSTDNGPDIASKYAEIDSRFRPIQNERMKGVSGARNTGIEHAQGEWVTFLDADDELTDGAGKIFRKYAKTGANMIQFNHKRHYAAKNKYLIKYANSGGDYGLENLPEAWWGVWNKLYKTEFLKQIRFDESLSYGEDGLFVLECMATGEKIRHADYEALTVIHHFDNAESLSKVKTINDIRKYIHTYEDFAFNRDSSAAMKKAAATEISNLWMRIIKQLNK